MNKSFKTIQGPARECIKCPRDVRLSKIPSEYVCVQDMEPQQRASCATVHSTDEGTVSISDPSAHTDERTAHSVSGHKEACMECIRKHENKRKRRSGKHQKAVNIFAKKKKEEETPSRLLLCHSMCKAVSNMVEEAWLPLKGKKKYHQGTRGPFPYRNNTNSRNILHTPHTYALSASCWW